MNDHISKPIEVDKFFATLSRWISASGKEDMAPLKGDGPDGGSAGEVRPPRPSVAEGALYLPGLELEKALSRLGNNERLYVKLLRQFLTYYGNTESQFYAAFDAGDLVTAQRIAHTLKGLAGSIGASSLAGESAFLEASFANKDLDATRSLAKICFTGLARVQLILREAFDAEGEQEPEAESGPAIPALTLEQKERKKELLDALIAYLRDDDAEASSFFSNHVREFQLFLSREAFSGLQGLISRFEFEEALELLAKHEELPEQGE